MSSTMAVLLLGFFLGLKHAIEADHLAAVSTLITEKRGLLSSSIVGGIWGLGHTLSLTAVGLGVLFLGLEISDRTERWLEFTVGMMLVLLGINLCQKLVRGGRLHFHKHEHDGKIHVHPHVHVGEEELEHKHHISRLGARPLFIGMVHGLAGSAALMLLVIPTIESRYIGLLYILIFGLGSIGGMMLMSFLMSLPLHFTAKRFERVDLLMRGFAAVFSICLGLWIVYEKGFMGETGF
jgi:sulfite exporter TauE/SafE